MQTSTCAPRAGGDDRHPRPRVHGLALRDGALWLAPRLPDELPELSMRIRFHGCPLDVTGSARERRVRAVEGRRVTVEVHCSGRRVSLVPGKEVVFALERD